MEALHKIAEYFLNWNGEEEVAYIGLTTQDLREISGMNVLNYKLKRELNEYKKIIAHLESNHPEWASIMLDEINSIQ